MNLWDNMRISLRSILANKMRSTLTVLGVVVGVAAVISMLSIGRGATASIQSSITSMGSNLLFVRPGSSSSGGVNQGGGSAATLTYDDAKALADPANVPDAAGVAPEADAFGQIIYMGNNARSRIIGVTPEYEDVRNATLGSGQFINQSSVTTAARVAVLGANVVAELFVSGEDPIGKTVRINQQPFIVIGTLKSKGGSGFGNVDDMVLVPLTTVLQRIQSSRFRGSQNIGTINVKATSEATMQAVTSEIQTVLRERHHILYQDDFTVQNQQDILSSLTTTTNTLTLFLGGIAAISLLVGGMGIMNIMLVSVTERTREIGIRKAVGARRADIQMQFLTEAVALSGLGGILGTLAGVAISLAMGRVSLGGAGITPKIQIDSVLLATGFSVIVGVVFGLYPASRAAGLKPIEALRYE